jgi:preprotein translocase SecE subunit
MTIMQWILLGLAAILAVVALANLKRLIALWARTQEFYREVVGEMRKVAWPTQEHVVNSTVVVGIAVIGLMVIIGGVDRLFGTLVEFIFASQ